MGWSEMICQLPGEGESRSNWLNFESPGTMTFGGDSDTWGWSWSPSDFSSFTVGFNAYNMAGSEQAPYLFFDKSGSWVNQLGEDVPAQSGTTAIDVIIKWPGNAHLDDTLDGGPVAWSRLTPEAGGDVVWEGGGIDRATYALRVLTVDALGNVLGVAEARAEAPDLTPPQPPAVYPGASAKIEVTLDNRHGALETSPWRITASDPVWGALYRQFVATGLVRVSYISGSVQAVRSGDLHLSAGFKVGKVSKDGRVYDVQDLSFTTPAYSTTRELIELTATGQRAFVGFSDAEAADPPPLALALPMAGSGQIKIELAHAQPWIEQLITTSPAVAVRWQERNYLRRDLNTGLLSPSFDKEIHDPLAKRQSAVLANRAWQASSMGVMEGWRQRPQDESQNCLIVIGAGRQASSKDLTRSVRYIPRMKQALARRPSRSTVSVKVESLACRDWGDDPLLADGQEWDGDSPRRHEVATYLPRTSESSTPFLIHLQPLLESKHVFAPGQAMVPGGAYSLDLDAGSYELRYGSGWAWRGAADEHRPVHLALFMALPGGQPQQLLSESYPTLRGLLDAIDGGRFREPLARLELPGFGQVRLWCELSGEQVGACISLLVTGKGSRRAAIERPELPYVINDFLNYDDAESPLGRRLSGAPREWPDADDPGLPAGAGQWHDADYADTVPAGKYALTPAVILPEKDGYELELVAHAFRSDIGHRIQVGSAPADSIGEPGQVTEVSLGQPFRLLLPPLVPVAPQNFSKEVSGWGLGSEKVTNRTFTAVADPRIAPEGSCRGLITTSAGMLLSSELRPGQTAFSRIVVGTPHSGLRLYWLDRSSGLFDPLPPLVPVPLGLSREGRSLLWVSDYLLPAASPRRLGIAFPDAAGQERSLYGVWLIDEAPSWQVLVEKDGAAWNGATGSTGWTDIGALPAGKAMSRFSLHSLLLSGALPKGSYRFRLVAQTISSTLRQTVGNYLRHELAGEDGATETNQGTEVQIQVKVNY